MLNPLPGYTYQTLQYETTVNSYGKYLIELHCATHQAVNVEITANDFSATRILTATTTDTYYFNGGPVPATIGNGERNFKNITYF